MLQNLRFLKANTKLDTEYSSSSRAIATDTAEGWSEVKVLKRSTNMQRQRSSCLVKKTPPVLLLKMTENMTLVRGGAGGGGGGAGGGDGNPIVRWWRHGRIRGVHCEWVVHQTQQVHTAGQKRRTVVAVVLSSLRDTVDSSRWMLFSWWFRQKMGKTRLPLL